MRPLRGFVLAMLLAAPAWAVEPDEILDDPALEARAREVSKELRCLVCRNESIDESHAGLAKDLRILVRERIVEGDSNDEVVTFLTDRYGEFVLLRPTATGANLILWIAGPVMLVVGAGIAFAAIRRRAAAAPDPLSADEQRRLSELLDDAPKA